MGLLDIACEASMPRERPMKNKQQPVYWWNEEIARLRNECHRLRRSTQRPWKNHPKEARLLSAELNKAKKRLGKEIKRSKIFHWKQLYAESKAIRGAWCTRLLCEPGPT